MRLLTLSALACSDPDRRRQPYGQAVARPALCHHSSSHTVELRLLSRRRRDGRGNSASGPTSAGSFSANFQGFGLVPGATSAAWLAASRNSLPSRTASTPHRHLESEPGRRRRRGRGPWSGRARPEISRRACKGADKRRRPHGRSPSASTSGRLLPGRRAFDGDRRQTKDV